MINLKNVKKHKIRYNLLHQTYNLYSGHNTTERTKFYRHFKMTVGVKIRVGDKHGGYWNKKMEVLAFAVHNGYEYVYGMEKYNTDRSLQLRLNNFVKHILNDKTE